MTLRVKRRSLFAFSNKYQGKIISLVLSSVIASVMVTAIVVFSFSFIAVASEMPDKEFIKFNVVPAALKSGMGILLFMPILLFIIFIVSQRVSNRLVGPLGRLNKELDDRISLKDKKHIFFRKGDYLNDLAEKINKLIDLLP